MIANAMNSLYKFSVSLIAAVPLLIALTIVRLVSSARTDILKFGFPFTFYEQGGGTGVLIHRFVGFGVVADVVCLLLIVAAISWGWNRVPRLLSGSIVCDTSRGGCSGSHQPYLPIRWILDLGHAGLRDCVCPALPRCETEMELSQLWATWEESCAGGSASEAVLRI